MITAEKLKEYYFPEKYIKWFQEKYPSGAEIRQIFTERDQNQDDIFYHWIKDYFRLSPDESLLYKAMLNIDDYSKFYSHSSNLSYSKIVFNSTNITDSSEVFDSMNIHSSHHIYASEDIARSNDIIGSKKIDNSKRVFNSIDVRRSEAVVDSGKIEWSHFINNSGVVNDSMYIETGKNISNSAFCFFCKDLENCMFCYGLKDKSYHIFNTPVSPREFDYCHGLLDQKIQKEKNDFIKVDSSKLQCDDRYIINRNVEGILSGLSADFYGFISTLPNFSEDTFFQLFFSKI